MLLITHFYLTTASPDITKLSNKLFQVMDKMFLEKTSGSIQYVVVSLKIAQGLSELMVSPSGGENKDGLKMDQVQLVT